MSANLKIITLAVLLTSCLILVYLEKISWEQFAGIGVIAEGVILIIEKWIQAERERDIIQEARATILKDVALSLTDLTARDRLLKKSYDAEKTIT